MSHHALRRAIAETIPDTALTDIIASPTPVKVKFGADPSAPDLHLGHAVVLRVLRHLQDLGHTVQFLIGDFTAMIGDPTGKSETRPILTSDQVKENALTYHRQVMKLLREDRTEVVFNSEWLDRLSSRDMIQLSAKYTVARMMERDDFQKRFAANIPISIHEFMYPLLQGYDSVVLGSDVEIGGTDQKFNLLMGRHLQRDTHQAPQKILMTPILEGLDGVQKMSKSLGNHVAILDSPRDMFGKLMSIPDSLIVRYVSLLTDRDDHDIFQIANHLNDGTAHPKLLKESMAREVVAQFHSESEAVAANDEFNRVFSKGDVPSDIPELPGTLGDRLSDLLVGCGAVPSKKEFYRLVQQSAISIDDIPVRDMFATIPVPGGQIIRIGKRRFYRLV